MKKRPPAGKDKECARRLKEIWQQKKHELHLTQDKAADIMGMSQGAVGQYINGITKMSADIKIRFADMLGVDVADIDPELGVSSMGSFVAEPVPRYRVSPFVPVPMVDNFYNGGDGDGMAYNEQPEFLKHLSFRKEWLDYESLNPRNLSVAMVHGKSMEPTLREADVILLDTSENGLEFVKDGKVYAITVKQKPLVKRLYKQELGGILLQSDNPSFKEIIIDDDELNSFRVVGRVVWSAGKVD